MEIHHLFPDPIYICRLGRALTSGELKVLNTHKKKTYKNIGNLTSLNTYVLEQKKLKNLKRDLNKKISDYFKKIVCPSGPIIPYITQSWLNYTNPKGHHHRHSHTNSYISGVFYIEADEKIDKIHFYRLGHQPAVDLVIAKYNHFNSSSWWFPVGTGDLILFPSFLVHGVDETKGPNLRASLSFNTFIKGKIGATSKLNSLLLE